MSTFRAMTVYLGFAVPKKMSLRLSRPFGKVRSSPQESTWFQTRRSPRHEYIPRNDGVFWVLQFQKKNVTARNEAVAQIEHMVPYKEIATR